MSARIVVGTCGYSYRDWIGPVYPAGTRNAEMLGFYGQAFGGVEIDSTYYRVPAKSAFATMAERTPEGFRFTAKAPGTATHLPLAKAAELPGDLYQFVENIAALDEAGKFACVLLQFPYSFAPGPLAEDRLDRLREAIPYPIVVEFRNRGWQRGETHDFLREREMGWCNVDEPSFGRLMKPSSDAIGPVGYFRFHGRNAKQWWRPERADLRYDYLYSAEELAPWTDRVADVAADPEVREVFAFFNNHRMGQAVRNAEMLESMLSAKGVVATP